MKRTLLFICTLLCANVLFAQYFDEGDLTYRITGAGKVAVNYCSHSATSVNIPSTVTHAWKHYSSSCDCYITDSVITYSVTSIGGGAFEGRGNLTSITIPNSVTSIGSDAFAWCPSLTSVTIPNSVTSIGQEAFRRCISLTSVTIPNSVTYIGRAAFYDCSSLTSVTLSNNITELPCRYYGIETYGFFENCSSLTSVTIPNNVTSIGDDAFAYCSSLNSITIPNSVTSIGDDAFDSCINLTSVTIGNSVSSIGEGAFQNCSSLTNLNYNAINYNFDYSHHPFENCPISTINIGNSVQIIPNRFAYNLDNLTSVTIGNSVTSIGYEAFAYCYSLTSVTIGNSVTSIGSYAFEDCYSLTSVTIPNSVTSIGNYAFNDCSSLTSVTIGNSVTSIGDYAFAYCSSLTNLNYNAINYNFDYSHHPFENCPISTINIGNSVQIIPNSFACGLDSLTSVTIGNSVTSIGDGAFSGCSSLTSVTIPNSVTSIGDYAFSYCSSLNSVTIGNSVTAIGADAFAYCDNLTTFYYNAINCSDFSYPFRGTPITTLLIGNGVQIIPNSFAPISLTEITIPNSVTSIGDYAFDLCSSLTSIDIPNSVTSIGNQAFSDCSSLTSVTSLATNPPALGGSAFDDIGSPSTLYVPNGCRQAYQNSYWAPWFDCIVELGSNNSITNLNVEVNNEEWGSVEVNEGLCGTDTLRAVAEMYCSEFLRWSDGNTNNPRVVNVTSDTSFTAIFKDPVLDTTIDATIMQGETYNLNGQELSEEGVYNATVLSVAGCEINLTVNLYVIPNNYTNGETSSLSDAELEEIAFYPNPTKSLISFSKTIERIEVVDINGKILLSFSNVREINIGDLPAGSYLLRLHSNENSVLRKVVKE